MPARSGSAGMRTPAATSGWMARLREMNGGLPRAGSTRAYVPGKTPRRPVDPPRCGVACLWCADHRVPARPYGRPGLDAGASGHPPRQRCSGSHPGSPRARIRASLWKDPVRRRQCVQGSWCPVGIRAAKDRNSAFNDHDCRQWEGSVCPHCPGAQPVLAINSLLWCSPRTHKLSWTLRRSPCPDHAQHGRRERRRHGATCTIPETACPAGRYEANVADDARPRPASCTGAGQVLAHPLAVLNPQARTRLEQHGIHSRDGRPLCAL